LKKTALVLCLLAAVISGGCASVTGPAKWTAQPAAQGVIRPDYRIEFRPVKRGKPYFSAFAFSIQNTAHETIVVDWQATRYLHDGTVNGRFMFEGITADIIRNVLPRDRVAPGGRLTREIWPIKLVAMAPYRDQNVTAGKSGFSPGVLPAGRNGIRLVLRNGAKTVTETLSVIIARP